MPAAELESQADTLKKWRDKNVIIYCDTGTERRKRGARACQARIRQGLQPARRAECLAEGQYAADENGAGQGQFEMSQPASPYT